MDAASSINVVSEKVEIPKRQLSDILSDPKSTLYFMVGFAVIGSLLFIGFTMIENSFTADKEVDKIQEQDLTPEEKVVIDLDPKRKSDVDHLNSAINSYYRKNQIYPQSLSALVPQYLASVPRDPDTQREYSYRVTLDFKSYQVWAVLDDGTEYSLTN